MIVNASTLRDLFSGFNVSFNKGFQSTVSHWDTVAMKVPSSGRSENYSWLIGMPSIREWLGDRIINSLSAARYVIENKEFELTVSVKRTQIEDDQYGIYGKPLEQMGYETAQHPDDMVFSLMGSGTVTKCYDSQYFFDTDHPGYDIAGEDVSVSNYTDGASTAWYLMDCKQPIKPLVYQERHPFIFESITNNEDAHVFMKGEFVYGVRGRSNAGFGLWQLAHCSKVALDATSFEAARNAMSAIRKPSGKPMGIVPTHLVVPTSLEGTARKLINAELIAGGESNIWAKSVEVIVSPFL
ncbi:MAG: Mu-like prophage major head subunit gpT family protein [Allorhizobium sp.]